MKTLAATLVVALAAAALAEDSKALTSQTYDLAPILKAYRAKETRPPLKNASEKLDYVAETPDMFFEGFPLLVSQIIDPQSWKISGGKGEMKWAGKKLQVKQTKENHARLAEFLEALKSPRLLSKPAPAAPQTEELITVVYQIADLPASAASSEPIKYPIELQAWLELLMKRVQAAGGKENWRDTGAAEGDLLFCGTLLIIRQKPVRVAAIDAELRKWAGSR
jgi:hypothetical protein